MLLILLLSTGMAASQTAKRTRIIGLPPYEFGVSTEAILRINSTLQQAPLTWTGVQHYRGRFEFTIPGAISVHFWMSKLAHIEVSWASLRRIDVEFLYRSIVDSYDLAEMKAADHSLTSAGAVLLFRDKDDSYVAFSGGTVNSLKYSWGEFQKSDVTLAPRF
jgi:hypothetical protein